MDTEIVDVTRMVVLGPLQLLQAAHLAGLFRGVKKAQAASGELRNRRTCGLDDFGIHYVGALGEVAVATALGVPVRDDVTTYGDGDIDMTVLGQTVQIKTSTHATLKRERLVFLDDMSKFRANWLVACSVATAYSVAVHGFISREKFAKLHFKHDFGYGPRVAVKASWLADIGLFMGVLERAERQTAAPPESVTQ